MKKGYLCRNCWDHGCDKCEIMRETDSEAHSTGESGAKKNDKGFYNSDAPICKPEPLCLESRPDKTWDENFKDNIRMNEIMMNNIQEAKKQAYEEQKKGKTTVLILPVLGLLNMLFEAGAEIRSCGRVKWVSGKDGSRWKSPSHCALFILRGKEEMISEDKT